MVQSRSFQVRADFFRMPRETIQSFISAAGFLQDRRADGVEWAGSATCDVESFANSLKSPAMNDEERS